ncbi:MAG: nuclear transport factor 2 family protein [Rhodospirillaceae bacterium]|nr:nuclear transport factor 2 family protein [Rhodospirillaceae bacterium]
MTAADTAPLEATLAAWAAAWRSASPTQVLALWDKADRAAWYLPADSIDPYIGAAVVGYVQRRCVAARTIGYRVRDAHLRRLHPDLGLAFFTLDWSQTTPDHPVPVGGSLRVTLLMRRTPEGWRVFHYAEAPLAPLLELQAFYEKVAAEGFAGMPRRDAETGAAS